MTAPYLQVSDLSFSRADVPLVTGASFRLNPGITGVVGPNGAGKSTLLSVLAGEIAPSSGSVVAPAARLCRQEPALDDAIRRFAAGDDPIARAALHRLGLDPSELERWPTLSPGERRRWQIAAALADAPELLLLDEPTDHLDADARDWLVAALQGFRGIARVVSHDRALLDALATRTLRLSEGRIALGTGGATAALGAWESDRRGRIAALDAASAAEQRSRRALADSRRERDATARSTSGRARMRGPKDHDATGIIATTKAAWADTSAGKRVRRAKSALEAVVAARESLARPTELGGEVSFPAAPGARPRLVAWRGELVAGDRVLARDVELVIDRGERVRVTGRNGAGKTTLLGTALAAAGLPEDRVLALPQELGPDRVAADLAALRALPRDVRGRVLQAVACLGVRPERLLATERPSPGEARKLALALGLGRGAWLLALDEPTNHLDLPSIARLEDALCRYDGAIALITHDPAFAARIARREVALDAST
jgi:ATPase subunit of ABC transporter with duplicated ATPase domains